MDARAPLSRGGDLLALLDYYPDLDTQLEFFRGSSDFYPEFDAYCRQLVIEQFERRRDQ